MLFFSHDKNIYVQSSFVKKRKILHQFIKYSIVGVSNALIGFGTMFLLLNYFKVNYIISNTTGYILGLINSFIWNKRWTFQSGNHYSKEIFRFLVVFIVSYLSNLVFLIVLVEIFDLNQNISFILSSMIYIAVGFTANRIWTFS
jgi:putative flippase GtrA